MWKYLLVTCLGLILLGAVALSIKPRPFPSYPQSGPVLKMVELPADLPAPVLRYYKAIIGDSVPVIESAIVTGRARLRFMGIPFQGRFRFTHDAGQGYRHYIEATLFGIPVMKVNETYLGGRARLELPFGIVEDEPKVDSAANLGLWAESIWLPSVWVTDPRVRWEPIDDHTARLVVPFADKEDSFTVSFDPQTGLIQSFEAMRWREAADESKILWRNEALGWSSFHELLVPSPASVTWLDEGSPWLIATVEEIVYNVDVTTYIQDRGY